METNNKMLGIEKKPERNIQISFRIRDDLEPALKEACKDVNSKKGYLGQSLLEHFLLKNYPEVK